MSGSEEERERSRKGEKGGQNLRIWIQGLTALLPFDIQSPLLVDIQSTRVDRSALPAGALNVGFPGACDVDRTAEGNV